MPPDTARTYRVLAAEAETRALFAANRGRRAEYKSLAKDWRDLADRVEQASMLGCAAKART